MSRQMIRFQGPMGFVASFCFCLLIGQTCHAIEAYVGSDADGAHALYRISFADVNDVTVEPSIQFSRSGSHEIMMVSLRPDTPMVYLFTGPEIVIYNLDTKELERRHVPGGEVEYFAEPAFFSPTGELLYTFSVGASEARGLLLDSDTLETISTLPYQGEVGSVYAVAFTPDESALSVARENSVVSYPIYKDGKNGLEFQAEHGTLVAELPPGTTHRLVVQGDRLLV